MFLVDTPLNQYSGICLLASDIRITEDNNQNLYLNLKIEIYEESHIGYNIT
jgi:hypothetical protein